MNLCVRFDTERQADEPGLPILMGLILEVNPPVLAVTAPPGRALTLFYRRLPACLPAPVRLHGRCSGRVAAVEAVVGEQGSPADIEVETPAHPPCRLPPIAWHMRRS